MAWDETRLVCGYPGDVAVLARRSGDTWYVAGVNGNDEERELSLPLPFLDGKSVSVQTFADSRQKESPWLITTTSVLPSTITCQPRGGFVMRVKCQ